MSTVIHLAIADAEEPRGLLRIEVETEVEETIEEMQQATPYAELTELDGGPVYINPAFVAYLEPADN